MRALSALVFVTALLIGESAAKYSAPCKEETKTLDQLYQDAINEGGNLVVYHGGDTPTKYHNVRIDNQLETNSLVPDVVALQTLQDFPRWADEGKLLNYKPANFPQIYDGFKDPNGAWFAYIVYAFTYFSNQQTLGSLPAPATPLDLVDPKYKGLIASSYPHDDDAALFVYVNYVEKYGWDWVAKFATQEVSFNRGSNVAGDLVAAGTKSVFVGSGGNTQPAIDGKYPFIAWGQRITILKKAKNVATAKLLLSWLATESTQRLFSPNWTVRKDLATTAGSKQVWEVPEAGVAKFTVFMEDRERVEMWKQTFALYFGEVQGEPTPGVLGLHPGA